MSRSANGTRGGADRGGVREALVVRSCGTHGPVSHPSSLLFRFPVEAPLVCESPLFCVSQSGAYWLVAAV